MLYIFVYVGHITCLFDVPYNLVVVLFAAKHGGVVCLIVTGRGHPDTSDQLLRSFAALLWLLQVGVAIRVRLGYFAAMDLGRSLATALLWLLQVGVAIRVWLGYTAAAAMGRSSPLQLLPTNRSHSGTALYETLASQRNIDGILVTSYAN